MILRHLPRAVAALAFAAATTSAMVIGGARDAGTVAAGPLSAAPAPASAAVFVGIGVGRYPRWRFDVGYRAWRPYGFYYGRPGYVGGFFVGYAPPTVVPYWYHPYYPYYGFHAYFGRPYFAHYGPAFYGRGYYGRGYYGRGYYGRGFYGRGGYGRR